MFYWRWFNRPRHPLLRVLLGALGAVLLVGILVLGFFALVAFAFVGAIVALVRAVTRSAAAPRPASPIRDPRVIEGEYSIVRDRAALKH